MPDAVLDTSVLVRYLTRDDAAKAAAAESYLQSAKKDALLFPDVAMVELAFILLRMYRWPATGVAEAIRAVVNDQTIVVPGNQLWLQAADDLENGYGPVDAYLLRAAKQGGMGAVITFDERMKALSTVRCIIP